MQTSSRRVPAIRPAAERALAARLPTVRFSLDTWAVGFALLAALLVRTGVLKHVPW